MKIGIITFHRATNCGATLQTFGLFQFLKNHGHTVEIIDYIPNDLAYVNHGKIHKFLHKVKLFLNPVETSRNKNKENEFINFISNHFMLSQKKYYGDRDIEQAEFDYDLIISGSDQILNTTLTGVSKAYYLHFTKIKKISYASSFGRVEISETEKQLIKKYLKRFDAISVREKCAISTINNLIGNSPTLVCDPVFLLSRKEWNNMTMGSTNKSGKYIFIYLMEDSKINDAVIEAIKRNYNLPIVTVIGGKVSNKYDSIDYSCGPQKFIEYIYNAQFVMTNSFHASAFSIIFGKKFCTVAHSCRNARLENLFEILGESERIINKIIEPGELEYFIVNGEHVYLKLEDLIETSRKYLSHNIVM